MVWYGFPVPPPTRNSEAIKHMLNAYLRWYGDVRMKSDLDYRSPMQYRRDLGLLAA
ncbi:IS3 family transposase [Olsenella sp. AM39-30AC]|uniref:IS3 family transposase n=1 Tax=Olsenella sp. AM39-30AC TaxID=2292360 RepID=UPI00336BD68A